MKANVIGSGITGILTAYYLHKEGYEVTVYHNDKDPSDRTSFANGCQLSASNAEVWNSWKNVFKGIKWMFKKDAPLSIKKFPIKWFIKFLWNIKGADHRTIKTTRMAIQSHKLLYLIEEDTKIKYDRLSKGIMHIYKDNLELNDAVLTNSLYKQGGLYRKLITASHAERIEPALNMKKRLQAFYTKQDFTGDINKFIEQLTKWLTKKKVKFVKKEIKDITLLRDLTVVCAGVNSKFLSEQTKDNIDIYPVKGYSITFHNVKNAPYVSLLDDESKIVTARIGNRLRVAGTAEFNGYDKKLNADRIFPLIEWATNNFPKMKYDAITKWTGLRPMTPDMMPVVKRSNKYKNIYFNTGHGHLGWTLSAYTSHKVVELIQHCKSLNYGRKRTDRIL